MNIYTVFQKNLQGLMIVCPLKNNDVKTVADFKWLKKVYSPEFFYGKIKNLKFKALSKSAPY